MFLFIWDRKFEESLKEIEPCPHCGDRLMREIEKRCSEEIACGSHGYGAVRLRWRFQKLLMWYFVFGLTINALDLAHDLALHQGKRRAAA